MIYLISYRYNHCWVSGGTFGRPDATLMRGETKDAITIENNPPGAWFYNKMLAYKKLNNNPVPGESCEEVVSIVSVVEVPETVIPESHWVALE